MPCAVIIIMTVCSYSNVVVVHFIITTGAVTIITVSSCRTYIIQLQILTARLYEFCIVSPGLCTGNNDTSLHPDKTNCYYFYQCIGLKAYRLACPTGLQFNVVKNRCDYPSNVKCVYGGSPPTVAPPKGKMTI